MRKLLLFLLLFSLSYSTFSQVPINDLCENAIELSWSEPIIGTTINATNDSVQAPDCNGVTTETGVWYKLPADIFGNVVDITTCSNDTDFNTKISVYRGDCSNLVCVSSNDEYYCYDWSIASGLQLSEYELYGTLYILVHGANGEEGQFALKADASWICFDVNDEVIKGFKYYPVPTYEIINLSALDTIDSVTLYNLSGQIVISDTQGVTNLSINVSTLKAGLYIMKVIVGEQTGVYRLIKE